MVIDIGMVSRNRATRGLAGAMRVLPGQLMPEPGQLMPERAIAAFVVTEGC
jgi:hypothetical protein